MRRLVAGLLFLFPEEFRRRFGADMLATFDARRKERPGWRTGVVTVLDVTLAAAQERCRRPVVPVQGRKGDSLMTTLMQDLRFAARTLLRSRGFTVVALAILALGIGVNTAMFSVAHAVLWRSLPYPHPERLVLVGEVDAHNPDSYWGCSYSNLSDWRSRTHAFEGLAGVMGLEHILRDGANPVRVRGAAVSHEFFPVMDVRPLLGRVFGEREDRKGAPGVVVLSHRMWVEHFGGDPGVLGRTIHFGTTADRVIGVMPAGFEYRRAEFWTPLEQEIDPTFVTHRDIWVLDPIGRLRPGVSVESATKEVETMAAQIRRDHPETRREQIARVSPLGAELSRDLRPAMLVLLGAVGAVLLIVCGNIAALMLVRGTARAKEMAVRRALGVGHARLVRQLLTESALLACVGGAGGIGLAFLATRALGLLTDDPRLLNVAIDGTVLAFAAAATVVTTLLFGIVPAISAACVGAAEVLRSGSRTGGSREKSRAQRMLVVLEVALCLVLLAGAGLLTKSFRKVFEVNPGFRADGLVTVSVGLPINYDSDGAVNQFYRRLEDRLASVPGVSGATIVSQLPISGGEGNGDIEIEGRPSAEGELGASTFRRVIPNYFSVMGIPLIRGRFFEKRDDGSSSLHSAIVNEGFARRFWPNTDPIGRRYKVGPRDRAAWLTIVGVVGDVRQIGLDTSAPFSTYEPMASDPHTRFDIAVRTTGDTSSVMNSVRREIRSLEPGLLIDKTETMAHRIDESVAPRRLNLLLFDLFAGLALLLAAVGLYGVVAYTAGQRSQEFGIRMALGAQGHDVLQLVMSQGLKLALTGTTLGVVAALYVARLMKRLLFGVEPTDPTTLLGVSLLLMGVALAACWLPARRATRIAPIEALRME